MSVELYLLHGLSDVTSSQRAGKDWHERSTSFQTVVRRYTYTAFLNFDRYGQS